MKKDILKIAGVKSEKEFYKKYPTEAAFMKAHKKEFKKAAMGASMVNKQLTQLTDFANPPQAYDGMNFSGNPLRSNLQKPSFMQPFDFNAPAYQQYQPMGLQDSRYEDVVDPSVYDITGMDRYYKKPLSTGSSAQKAAGAATAASAESPDNMWGGVKNVIQGGIQMKEDRENLLRSKQWATIAGLVGKGGKKERVKNKYDFPWDRPFDPNQLSRSYGTGYDVLQSAQDGMQIGGNPTEIQNMYTNDDTLYSDLGYEPLQDSVKQYATGGMFPDWQSDLTQFGSQNAGTVGGGLGSFAGGGSGKTSGTSTMLSGVGQLAGTALGGPLGGVIGSAAGGLLGGVLSAGQERKMKNAQNQIASLGGTQSIYNFQDKNSGFLQNGGSIVDYMKANNMNSSYNNRKKMYKNLFGEEFSGTPEQNTKLLKQLRSSSSKAASPSKAESSKKSTKAAEKQQAFGPLPAKKQTGVYDVTAFPENRNLESGVIVDKNTNNAYVLQGNKIVKSFPVLTGQARDSNINEGYNYVENHPEGRATPTGSYMMNPAANLYGEPGFRLNPIAAFDQSAPRARSLAEHITYNPSERDKYYDMPGDKRNRSHGCVNCRKSDINQLTSMFPKGDTTMVIDTRNALDQNFLSNIPQKEHGGWVSHDWQPQVITQFGGYDMKDLFKDDPTMDTLRAGGNVGQVPYTPASARAMQTYAMGGDVQVDDRGDIESQGYNPITAASGANGNIGITRGPSHDDGGFNVQRGDNVVEVEGGETALYQAEDGASIDPETGQPKQNFLILGDMKTDYLGKLIGQNANKSTLKKITEGNKIEDMKFKKLGNNVAKLTGKLNKKESKYLDLIDSDDRLKQATARAGAKGIEMQYEDLHNIQNDLMAYQEVYHSAAKDYGYDDTPEFLKDLKQGKIEDNMGKFGAKMETAQFGLGMFANEQFNPQPIDQQQYIQKPKAAPARRASVSEPIETTDLSRVSDTDLKNLYTKAKAQGRGKAVLAFQKAFHAKYPDLAKSIIGEEKYGITNLGKSKSLTKADLASNEDALFGPRTERYMAAIRQAQTVPGPEIGKKTTPTPPNITAKVPDISTLQKTGPVKDKTKLADLYNMFSPYFKPLIKNPLDPRSLAGELSRNRTLEGVKAQSFQPYLETPYSVSFQDQMNANQADFNAMQRQIGSNPSALATLAGQKYAANSGVLGQQSRANQELQMGAYNRNRATLNDASLKNLATYDQQANRQSIAKSIRDAQLSADLTSMGDKYARARSEELAANVQANMYPDYTFGPKGRIYNTGMANFDIPQNVGADPEFARMYADYLEKKSGKSKSTAVKNGGLVKEYKKL
jgi:lipoprotein-anchoring transpeptidase ErfK/SrfK